MKFDVTKNGKATVLKLHGRKLDSSVSPELKAEFLVLCKPKVAGFEPGTLHQGRAANAHALTTNPPSRRGRPVRGVPFAQSIGQEYRDWLPSCG